MSIPDLKNSNLHNKRTREQGQGQTRGIQKTTTKIQIQNM